MSWENVTALGSSQRIWILASLDGHFFFQSGWVNFLHIFFVNEKKGAYVANSSGSAIVTDGCFGNYNVNSYSFLFII